MTHRATAYLTTAAALALMVMLQTSPARAAVSGEAIATRGAGSAPGCASCHGQHGEGNAAAGFPRLAGQPAGYLHRQLEDYASGARGNAVMQPIAKALSNAEMAAVAKYYAGLETASASTPESSGPDRSRGRELVVNGQWDKHMPACISCHGPGARGVAPHFPALAGQSAGYIEAQIEAWQQDKRHNDPQGLMQAVARTMDEEQVRAVAAYLASLPATGPIPDSAAPDTAPAQPDALQGYFQPPLQKDLPDDEFGESVRRGERMFTRTHDSAAAKYIGNGLDCVNCHVNRGRQAGSAPMWAAWVLYPKYRSKNHKINTMAERLRGCFTFSSNAQASTAGHAPPPGSQVLVDLESYMYWLATGVPTGKKMKGQGYPELDKPAKPFDRERGRQVYAENCAICHGDDGQGTKSGGAYVFPPLWGAQSFNWGAGMHRVNTAAGFIEANMPLGKPGSLSAQQAWDVAAFIDSHPRPQDPRFDGNLDETIQKHHSKRDIDYYGKTVDGYKLGAPGTLDKWQSQRGRE